MPLSDVLPYLKSFAEGQVTRDRTAGTLRSLGFTFSNRDFNRAYAAERASVGRRPLIRGLPQDRPIPSGAFTQKPEGKFGAQFRYTFQLLGVEPATGQVGPFYRRLVSNTRLSPLEATSALLRAMSTEYSRESPPISATDVSLWELETPSDEEQLY